MAGKRYSDIIAFPQFGYTTTVPPNKFLVRSATGFANIGLGLLFLTYC